MRVFLNLLPLQYRQSELVRHRLWQWSLIWALCLATVAGAWWWKQRSCRRSQYALETAQRRHLPLQELLGECKTVGTELGKLQARGTLLGQLRDERPPLTLIGVVSKSAGQCHGRLVVQSLSFQRCEKQPKTDARQRPAQKKEPPAPAAEENGPWATVSATGEALDNLAVATFVAALRDTGVFRRVELKSSVGKDSAHTQIRSYSVHCEI